MVILETKRFFFAQLILTIFKIMSCRESTSEAIKNPSSIIFLVLSNIKNQLNLQIYKNTPNLQLTGIMII